MQSSKFGKNRGTVEQWCMRIPPSHVPVARLSIRVVGKRRAVTPSGKSTAWDKALTTMVCALIALLMVGAFTGAVMAMDYLGGQLSQSAQELHRSGGKNAQF